MAQLSLTVAKKFGAILKLWKLLSASTMWAIVLNIVDIH
jgi:hypothetical protein